MRGWRPIPAALSSRSLQDGIEDLPPSTAGTNSLDEEASIGNKLRSVKRKNLLFWAPSALPHQSPKALAPASRAALGAAPGCLHPSPHRGKSLTGPSGRLGPAAIKTCQTDLPNRKTTCQIAKHGEPPLRYFSSSTSFSLAAQRSSIFFVSACVTLSSSSIPRLRSSSLIFFSFSRLSIASLISRRTLRTAVR